MKIKKVLDENPEITDELRSFFQNVLLNSINENTKLPHSFIEALTKHGVTSEMVENYLTATPRLICDFMDEHDVIIVILYHGNIGWIFEINGEPYMTGNNSRKEAETESVIASIEYYKNMFNENDEKK